MKDNLTAVTIVSCLMRSYACGRVESTYLHVAFTGLQILRITELNRFENAHKT